MGRGNKKNVKRTDTPRAPEEPETPARPQKRTVAANAHAIDHLATRMTNKDTTLSNITDMLSHISEKVGSNTECTGARNVRLGSVEIGPGASRDDEGSMSGRPRRSIDEHQTFFEARGNEHSPEPGPSGVNRTPPRHQPYTTPTPWRNDDRPTRGYRPTRGRTDTMATPPGLGWEPPVTIDEFEANPALARTVADALQAAIAPLGTNLNRGKHERGFPNYYVTRGPKRTKAQLGECKMPEYLYGFIQMMKNVGSREMWIDMNRHMEQVVTDARTYAWPSVRAWSEEICARVTEGTLLWSDQYEIDRLQTQISHAHSASAHQPTSSELNNNNILSGVSDAVRLARAAPPCRALQNGVCAEPTHHTLNGYRHLHVCQYCLTSKCLFLPHTQKECRSKQYRPSTNPSAPPASGFGN